MRNPRRSIPSGRIPAQQSEERHTDNRSTGQLRPVTRTTHWLGVVRETGVIWSQNSPTEWPAGFGRRAVDVFGFDDACTTGWGRGNAPSSSGWVVTSPWPASSDDLQMDEVTRVGGDVRVSNWVLASARDEDVRPARVVAR